MRVELFDSTNDPLRVISYAARTCYNSHDKDDELKRDVFVQGLIKSGHETPLEFASATFVVSGISRVCQNQMVRHRHASFCVQSERYVDMSNVGCVLPASLLKEYEGAYDYAEQAKKIYKYLISCGVKKEDARMLLPQGLETTLCVNMNFRAIRNFLKLRLDRHAQWEIRLVAKEIFGICEVLWPWLVEDLYGLLAM